LLVGGTVGAGAAVKLTESLSANLEYSFVYLPDLSSPGANLGNSNNSGTNFSVQFHTIRAGIDYHF